MRYKFIHSFAVLSIISFTTSVLLDHVNETVQDLPTRNNTMRMKLENNDEMREASNKTMKLSMLPILSTKTAVIKMKAPSLIPINCTSASDCEDIRMVCRNNTCACSRFHDHSGYRCVANITKIYNWLRKTISNESESVSQPIAFTEKQTEPFTILIPSWSKYGGSETVGLGVIPPVLWPVSFCIILMFIIYSAIIFNYI